MSSITLYRGDCLQEMQKIPAGSVDLVLTDPPYGTTKTPPRFKRLNGCMKTMAVILGC